MSNAVSIGVALGIARIRGRFAPALFAISGFFVMLAAFVERRSSPLRAADETLTGAVFGIAIPLCAYAVVSRVTAEDRLDDAANPTARFGWNRRGVALGLFVVAACTTVLVATFLSIVGVFVARGVSDPLSLSDSFITTRIAFAGGLAYASLLSMASLLGRRGGGRFIVLATDWMVGAGAGWLSAPMPRGHVANLLGAEPVLGLSQPTAFTFVFALSATYMLFALWRTAP